MAHDLFDLAVMTLNDPLGLEKINAVLQLHQVSQADTQPDPLLKNKAVKIANSKNIHTPRHVNHMTSAELQKWIDQHSQEK